MPEVPWGWCLRPLLPAPGAALGNGPLEKSHIQLRLQFKCSLLRLCRIMLTRTLAPIWWHISGVQCVLFITPLITASNPQGLVSLSV